MLFLSYITVYGKIVVYRRERNMTKIKKTPFLKGVKVEFGKIKWMKRSEVFKQLFTVVTIIGILAFIVVCSDMLGAKGFSLLTKFR